MINQEVIGIYGIAKDITDIKKTEKQLDGYHKRISTIFESITDAFCAVDRNWTVTYWNKEAEQLLSMPRENIVAKNLWEVYQDAIPLECYTEYHRAISEHIPVRFDQYFPPLNIWFDVSAFPSGDGLSIYFNDITKRKNAEEQLKLEKERYRNLFNLSPLPQWVYDTETLRFVYVNEAAITHYSYNKEEFLSMTIKDIRPAEDVEILKEIISTKVKTGAFNRSKVRHRKKNGELIFVNVESNPISFEGKSARLVIAIDNTKKLKAIQALEASEERFNIVSKATSNAIWDLDILSGKVVWNKGIKGIFGYKQVSLTQEWWYNQVHPDDVERVVNKLRLSIKNKKSKLNTEYRFRCADGTYKYVLDRAFLIFNKAGEPSRIIGSMQDITERINYIQAVEEQNLRLIEIAWTQSHVVRAPLARIMGLSSLISDTRMDKTTIKELLLYLDSSAHELDNIIQDIIKKTEEI